MLMKEINSKAFLITSLAILLAIGIVGTTISTPAASAFVENQIPTVVTIPLEVKSLENGQFLLI